MGRPSPGPWPMQSTPRSGQAMERNPEVIVLGEDVGLAGGVFRITEGLQERFGEDRVIDTPLNESGIVGRRHRDGGRRGRPVAEIQFDGFVYPAFDQIVSHLGRIRYRTRGNSRVPVVVRFPNGAGIGAHEHHCDSPEAYFVHAPGLVVVCPSTPIDAKGLLAAALEGDDPVIFLEPKVLYRAGREDVPDRALHPPHRAEPGSAGRAPTSPWSPTAGWSRRSRGRRRSSAHLSRSSTSAPCSRGTGHGPRLGVANRPAAGRPGTAALRRGRRRGRRHRGGEGPIRPGGPDRAGHRVRRSLAPVRHREDRPDRCRSGSRGHRGGTGPLTRSAAVFGSSQTVLDSDEWMDAVQVGRRLAEAGFEVITGGYGGTMEAVSYGASTAGGRVVGVTAPGLFPDRSGANPFVEELIEAPTLAGRIDIMLRRAEATITLPGSIGTATELLMAWNMNFIAGRLGGRHVPSVAVGAPWQKVGDALVLLIGAENDGIHWANTADEAVDWVLGQLGIHLTRRAGF